MQFCWHVMSSLLSPMKRPQVEIEIDHPTCNMKMLRSLMVIATAIGMSFFALLNWRPLHNLAPSNACPRPPREPPSSRPQQTWGDMWSWWYLMSPYVNTQVLRLCLGDSFFLGFLEPSTMKVQSGSLWQFLPLKALICRVRVGSFYFLQSSHEPFFLRKLHMLRPSTGSWWFDDMPNCRGWLAVLAGKNTPSDRPGNLLYPPFLSDMEEYISGESSLTITLDKTPGSSITRLLGTVCVSIFNTCSRYWLSCFNTLSSFSTWWFFHVKCFHPKKSTHHSNPDCIYWIVWMHLTLTKVSITLDGAVSYVSPPSPWQDQRSTNLGRGGHGTILPTCN